MNFVAADLGASSTRYVSDNGIIKVMPNNMVFVKEDDVVDQEPYSADIYAALDVTIESSNPSKYFPARVLVGDMANRYSSTNQRPSVMMNKHMQRINYVSTVLSVALAKYEHQLTDDLKVYLALPPIEVGTAKNVMKMNLVGDYVVTFHKMNNMQIKFRIVDLGIYEESFMALLAYFFDMRGGLREEVKQYAKGTVLSLDIGASTTDLAVVNNMHYLEKSGQTFKTGGNIARDILSMTFRAQYGFDVPNEMAELAMAEGRIQMGNGYDDCSEAVANAKQKFAAQIVEQMQSYFRMVNIPIQTIRAIVVSGGGSMEGRYIGESGEVVHTSKPISDFITEELNKVCSGVQVEQFSKNPRLANIMGLYVRANLDMRKNVTPSETEAKKAEAKG